ncbi:MAG: nucleoside monophosphate kinase [Candidatus Saccharimonadales bacterium]
MIIFMGVAGSGKSTQAGILAAKLSCPRLGVGDLLRAHMSGEESQKMLAGEMVPDEKLLPLLEKEVKKYGNQEFILDGSPRTMTQAKWWVAKSRDNQLSITAVIHLSSDFGTAKGRLLARHRPDDTETSIAERFNEYQNTIKPILDYLKKAGIKIHEIDGGQPQNRVADEITAVLGVKV